MLLLKTKFTLYDLPNVFFSNSELNSIFNKINCDFLLQRYNSSIVKRVKNQQNRLYQNSLGKVRNYKNDGTNALF
jgi:hypothetical protein